MVRPISLLRPSPPKIIAWNQWRGRRLLCTSFALQGEGGQAEIYPPAVRGTLSFGGPGDPKFKGQKIKCLVFLTATYFLHYLGVSGGTQKYQVMPSIPGRGDIGHKCTTPPPGWLSNLSKMATRGRSFNRCVWGAFDALRGHQEGPQVRMRTILDPTPFLTTSGGRGRSFRSREKKQFGNQSKCQSFPHERSIFGGLRVEPVTSRAGAISYAGNYTSVHVSVYICTCLRYLSTCKIWGEGDISGCRSQAVLPVNNQGFDRIRNRAE